MQGSSTFTLRVIYICILLKRIKQKKPCRITGTLNPWYISVQYVVYWHKTENVLAVDYSLKLPHDACMVSLISLWCLGPTLILLVGTSPVMQMGPLMPRVPSGKILTSSFPDVIQETTSHNQAYGACSVGIQMIFGCNAIFLSAFKIFTP